MRFCLDRSRTWGLLTILLLIFLGGLCVRGAGYDPLEIGKAAPNSGTDLVVHDRVRNRDIPLRVYLPEAHAPAPVIVLSPGLGGTYAAYTYLSEHWVARGYVVVCLQHPGSDDTVWKDKPKVEAMLAMWKAASLQNFLLRVKDVPAVLDQLATWNKLSGNILFGRLDLKHVGMSGHSFGAITTQAVSGQSFGALGPVFTDPRITAALALSPSVPKRGDATTAFGSVKIPWMLMTGTMDKSPIGDADAASRLGVYTNLQGAPKYEVILNKAEHSAFTNRALPGDSEPRDPNHHRVILALSTAFWDAYLRGDATAAAWLNGPGPRAMMETTDQWQLNLGTGG